MAPRKEGHSANVQEQGPYSGKHPIATGDIFCTYLHRGLTKPNNTTPKAFKA